MKRLKKILSGGFAAGLLFALSPMAHATGRTYLDQTLMDVKGSKMGLILAVVVLVVMFAAMIYFVSKGKSGRINVGWAVLSVVLGSMAMLLCIVGMAAGTVYTKADGDPAETVSLFYDSIKKQDYVAAYSCLSDYSSLGLEKSPESDNAKLTYKALQDSYEYTVMGMPQTDRLQSSVRVRFRYLDILSFEDSVASRTNDNLAAFVKANPISAVYDENDQYLPEVTEKAYADALAFVMDKADTYYTSVELNVKLEYSNGKWLIVTDDAMLRALMGGAMY